MSDKCVVCEQPEYYHYPKKMKFKTKKDFVCSKCTFTMCTTPRTKEVRIPRNLALEIDDLANTLLASD